MPKMLVMPYGLQATIVRGEYAMAAATFKARSTVLAADFREVWIHALKGGIRTERTLRNPPADWTRVSVRSPRSPNVDVGRNSSAAQGELEKGMTNYDQWYGEMGLDWREEFRKLKEQQDYAKSIGLNLSKQNPKQEPAI
jgi:hypothetical protein